MLEMEALQGEIAGFFLIPFMPKRTEMALPVPTKSFLETGPDTAMLFAPFRCTHPPPPVPALLDGTNAIPTAKPYGTTITYGTD